VAQDSQKYKIHSNKDTLKVDKNTSKTVVGDMSLEFLEIKAKGKNLNKTHSNINIAKAGKCTNKTSFVDTCLAFQG